MVAQKVCHICLRRTYNSGINLTGLTNILHVDGCPVHGQLALDRLHASRLSSYRTRCICDHQIGPIIDVTASYVMLHRTASRTAERHDRTGLEKTTAGDTSFLSSTGAALRERRAPAFSETLPPVGRKESTVKRLRHRHRHDDISTADRDYTQPPPGLFVFQCALGHDYVIRTRRVTSFTLIP